MKTLSVREKQSIQFRGWNSTKKQMLYQSSLIPLYSLAYTCDVLMEFTGMYDHLNCMVFEGDVINYPTVKKDRFYYEYVVDDYGDGRVEGAIVSKEKENGEVTTTQTDELFFVKKIENNEGKSGICDFWALVRISDHQVFPIFQSSFLGEYSFESRCIRVGNIFENPELIK